MDVTYCQGKSIGCVDVVCSVGCLDDHGLIFERVTGEIQLIAGTTPEILNMALDEDARESIGKGVVDCPRLLIRARICLTTIATSSSVDIGHRFVVFIAGCDRF
jgi:hypothetical protein